MGVGLGGCRAGGNRPLANKGVHKDTAGKNCRVCCRDADLRNMYRQGEYGGIQYVDKVVGQIIQPNTGGEGGNTKEK